MPNINHHQTQSHHQQQHQLPPHHHMHHQSQAIDHHSDHGPGPFDKVNGRHDLVEVKSKLDAEFRRFGLERNSVTSFDSFYQLLESFHQMKEIPFMIFYTDPTHGDLLPINNDENLAKAISLAKPLLRLFLQRKGESWEQLTVGRGAKKNAGLFGLSSLLPIASASPTKPKLSIGLPEDFRQVSQIIDVGPLPETCRRVRLIKHGSDRPLGFYIRDGTSVRVTPQGLEKVPGIFISRLLPGGLAEGTGLLAVNDEVLEVNGIEVLGKTLDQVTDMMVANSSNLIIKIRPATQRSLPLPPVSGITNNAFRSSQDSGSPGSRNSHSDESEDDEDEIKDHLASVSNINTTSTSTTTSSSTTAMANNNSTNPFISSPSSSSNNNGQSNAASRKNQQQMMMQQHQQQQHQHQQQHHHHHLHNQMTSGNFSSHSNIQYKSNEQENYPHQSQSQFSNRKNGMAHQSTSASSNTTSSLLKEPPIVSNIEDDLEDDVVTL